MSCVSNEALIALHVEGDLPRRDVPSLEAHLLSCDGCATFRDELRASQSALKSLGEAELPEASLQRIRGRALAAVDQRVPLRRPLLAPAWTLAGGVAFVAAVGLWSASTSHPHRVAIQAATAVTTRPPVLASQRPRSSVAPHGSAIRPPTTVSPSEEATVVEPSTALSPEDADQLARAVVEMAHVERLAAPDAAGALTAKPASLLVRLDTDDPNVVIYWQVDSNGG
jgi:hypothetical protein